MKLEPHHQIILDLAVQSGLLPDDALTTLPEPMVMAFITRLSTFRALCLAEVRVGAYEMKARK